MNKTCADCIHLKVCEDIDDGIQMCYTGYKGCERFKDKSRFIELPCAVGDKLYYPSANLDRVFEKTVDEIFIHEIDDDIGCYVHIAGGYVPFKNIGKTFYRTKEDAEKALKGGAE